MSSNYEWQKQYTKQRVGDAHRMAEAHRLAKAGRAERGPRLLAALLASIGRLLPRGSVVDTDSVKSPQESAAR